MLLDNSIELLARVPLFSGLDAKSLEAIVELNARRAFRPGQPIISAGAPADSAFLIVKGTAERLTASGEPSGHFYRAGSLLGEMGMFVDTEHETTVVATELVATVEITRPVMEQVLKFDPSLAPVLASRIQGRLAGLHDKLKVVEGELNRASELISQTGQTQPEPGHDRMDAPNHAPRPPQPLNGTSDSVPGSPRYDPAFDPGLNGASRGRGNSTR